MFSVYRFISKMLNFPDWCAERIAKWKKDIKLINLHKVAIIGSNFCCREYNEMEGAKCEIYNSNSKESVRIGNYVKINGILCCNKNGKIEIGNYTVIRDGAFISADRQVKIGNYCFISSDVLIYDNNGHPILPELRRIQLEKLHKEPIDNYEAENGPIVIQDDVWIGTRSIILKEVTIGVGSIVAAGAVVTRDVPSFSIVAGNPAKVVKHIKA